MIYDINDKWYNAPNDETTTTSDDTLEKWIPSGKASPRHCTQPMLGQGSGSVYMAQMGKGIP